MLHQQVGAPNLARDREVCCRDTLRAVVICHILLECIRVGAGWGLPSRVFSFGVEIVREVLCIGTAHLPTLGQTGWSEPVRLQSK
jgi:hypothetical protein